MYVSCKGRKIYIFNALEKAYFSIFHCKNDFLMAQWIKSHALFTQLQSFLKIFIVKKVEKYYRMATTDEPRLTLKTALKQYTGSPDFSFGDYNGDDHDIGHIWPPEA